MYDTYSLVDSVTVEISKICGKNRKVKDNNM